MSIGATARVLIIFDDNPLHDGEKLVDITEQYKTEIGEAIGNTLFNFAGMTFDVTAELEGWVA
jgi:hypothetical protein